MFLSPISLNKTWSPHSKFSRMWKPTGLCFPSLFRFLFWGPGPFQRDENFCFGGTQYFFKSIFGVRPKLIVTYGCKCLGRTFLNARKNFHYEYSALKRHSVTDCLCMRGHESHLCIFLGLVKVLNNPITNAQLIT